jgi:hypothetical protein
MAGVKKVEAKPVQNGSWEDISDTLSLEISDNCTVYVQATGIGGEVITKSVYVECFDRERPTVRASRSGRLLRVEAVDELSGVAAIFIDGEECTDLTDGTLEYRLDTRNTEEEQIWIQAKDEAGNLSTTVTVTNPYYKDPDRPENTTTGNTPAGSASTAAPPPAAATTVTPQPQPAAPTETSPPAANGTDGACDDTAAEDETREIPGVIVVGNKQFITIQTRDERIFYLIIDGDRDSDNVYFVTEPSTQDKLDAAKKREQELDLLFARIYEDDALGKLPANQFQKLSAKYQEEYDIIHEQIRFLETVVKEENQNEMEVNSFLKVVQKYTRVNQITPAILREFIHHIVVHHREDIHGETVQKVEIHFNFIGEVNLPDVEQRNKLLKSFDRQKKEQIA